MNIAITPSPSDEIRSSFSPSLTLIDILGIDIRKNMQDNNEVTPNKLDDYGGLPSYAEFERLVRELLAEAKRIHPDGGIVLTT